MAQTSIYDMMDLKALRCFWAVSRLGSLTKAGIELGISESAVSQRLKSLEAQVGSKLYETPGGRVRLTEAGHQAMEMAVAMFDRLEQFQDEVARRGNAGSVTIAAQDIVIRYILPEIVKSYTTSHPDVDLRILSRTANDTVDMVRQGEVDIGIVSRTPMPESLVFHAVRTYEAYLLLPVGHPLLRRGRPAFKSLLNEQTVLQYPLIVPEQGDPANSRVVQALADLGLPLNVAFEVGTTEALKHYVGLGLGIAVTSGICLTPEDLGRIEAIEIPREFGGTTDYGVVMRREKYVASALGQLLGAFGVKPAKA